MERKARLGCRSRLPRGSLVLGDRTAFFSARRQDKHETGVVCVRNQERRIMSEWEARRGRTWRGEWVGGPVDVPFLHLWIHASMASRW